MRAYGGQTSVGWGCGRGKTVPLWQVSRLSRSAARGFVLGYLLFALAILSIVTLATSQMIGKQDTARWIANSKDMIEDQANLISTQLVLCATLNVTETDAGYITAYPEGTDALVSSLICPATLSTIWDSGAGSYAPPKVSGFSDWKYFRLSETPQTSASVYFYITAVDLMGVAVLNGVKRRLGDGQVSLSSTNATSDTLVVRLLE